MSTKEKETVCSSLHARHNPSPSSSSTMQASPEITDGSSSVDESEVLVIMGGGSTRAPPPPSTEMPLDHEDSTVSGVTRFSAWADLQPELLGLVLKRLPCLTDRVRVRSICHPWRSNSQLQRLPLPFPWITLPDGAFLRVSDGKIHRMDVPEDACCQSSIDNWLFLMHTDGSSSLMDPFSGTTLELPVVVSTWRHEPHYRFSPESLSYKLVVALPLGASPAVAVLIRDSDIRNTFCVSRPGFGSYCFRDDKEPLMHHWDATVFQWEIYVVSLVGKLSMVEFCKDRAGAGGGGSGKLKINCLIDSFDDDYGLPEYLPDDDLYMSVQYLVECGGRLLSVRRLLRDNCVFSSETPPNPLEIFETAGFDVLEADLGANPCQWRKVTNFSGHAVFLNQQGSKSLPAGECTEYKEDCIYFMCDYDCPIPMNPLCDSGVYDIKTCKITPLMTATTEAASHCNGEWRPAWVFPPEMM